MFEALSQVANFDRSLPTIPPDDPSRLPEVFLVVGENDKVLEGSHGAPWGKVDVRGRAAELWRAIWGA